MNDKPPAIRKKITLRKILFVSGLVAVFLSCVVGALIVAYLTGLTDEIVKAGASFRNLGSTVIDLVRDDVKRRPAIAQTPKPTGNGSQPTKPPAASPSQQWYSGGTLHTKKVADWRTATPQNRLATSADFVIKLGHYESIPSDVRERAEDVETCISKVAKDANVDTRPVSEIGAICGVFLGY